MPEEPESSTGQSTEQMREERQVTVEHHHWILLKYIKLFSVTWLILFIVTNQCDNTTHSPVTVNTW